MSDDPDSLHAGSSLRTHRLIKNYKLTDESILLAAKVEWHITTPAEVSPTAGAALLTRMSILPNELRRIDGRIEVFVGDQQANGTSVHKRLMQVLTANLELLELDSVQFDDTSLRREPKFTLRPSSNPLPEGVIPKHRIVGHLDGISLRLTYKLNPKRPAKLHDVEEDPFAEDGFGDAEEEGLLRDFAAYRLPECLIPTLDGFCEKFMNNGLGQSFPMIFNGGVKSYYRREAAGINRMVTSMKAMIQKSKNKAFRKKNGKIFQALQAVMLENDELMNRCTTEPGEIPDEDELADATQKMTEQDAEEEDEGERFQRMLSEAMMGLCMTQCSKSMLKCDIPDMPTEPEPVIAEALPAVPSPVVDDGLIEEDCGSSADIADASEAFQAAGMKLRATTPYTENGAQSDHAATPKDREIATLAHDIERENSQVDDYDMMSDTISASMSDDEDLLSDTFFSQCSNITTGSLLSEDVWSLPDSPCALYRPEFANQQQWESPLALGSPPSFSVDHIEASLELEPRQWNAQSEESHRNSHFNERSSAIQQSFGNGMNMAVDHDEEEVYDF